MKRSTFLSSLVALGVMNPKQVIQSLKESAATEHLPVFFMGHGSPMNAIENNEFSAFWQKIGTEIPTPRAVLCVSAHWLTRGTKITAMNKPATIHDFGGFPKALFDVEYPAPGSPQLALETQQLVKSINIEQNHDWGLDHGTWSVVKWMYPKANIPVLQLSIDYYQPLQYHYNLAKELAELRNKGVLIIGSGNMVHNLRMVTFQKMDFGYDWAIEMNEKFIEKIKEGDHKTLINYESMGVSAKLAIPTPDHYLPLIYTLALQKKQEEPVIFNDKILAGSLNMTSVRFG